MLESVYVVVVVTLTYDIHGDRTSPFLIPQGGLTH